MALFRELVRMQLREIIQANAPRCGGRAGRVELATGIEGVTSRPEDRAGGGVGAAPTLGRGLGADGTCYIAARGSRGGTDHAGGRVGSNRGLVDNFNAILILFRTNPERRRRHPGTRMLQCPLQVASIERFIRRHDRRGEDALAALGQTPMIRCRAMPAMDCPDLPSVRLRLQIALPQQG